MKIPKKKKDELNMLLATNAATTNIGIAARSIGSTFGDPLPDGIHERLGAVSRELDAIHKQLILEGRYLLNNL